MNLSCTQVSSLLPFYIENKLNLSLSKLVSRHLENCPKCMEKYETLKKIFSGLYEAKEYIDNMEYNKVPEDELEPKRQDFVLVQSLSSYIDNELSDEESLKIKKYVVTNLSARKTLEELYAIKNILHESFEKSRTQIKDDFSKLIFRQLNINEEINKVDSIYKALAMVAIIAGVVGMSVMLAFFI